MANFRKLIIAQDDDDGVVFATGRLLVLNPGVTLSNAGVALDLANERADVALEIRGTIAAVDGPNSEPGIGILSEGDNAAIHVFSTGRFDCAFEAIDARGDNLHLTLDAGARIKSQVKGVVYDGAGGRLDIDGKIICLDDGNVTTVGIERQAADDGVVVDITGLIRADRGVVSLGDGDAVFNAGVIDATEQGFSLFGEEARFVNRKDGVVTAPESFGSDGTQRIVNRGEFNGNIFLGDDVDFFDGRQGVLNGAVFGGSGSDIYFVSNAATDIRENFDEGALDAVISSVNYVLGDNFEQLFLIGKKDINATGNSDANRLSGNDGENRLNGKGGNDFLDAGDGKDIFVFQDLGGADTIFDFQNNQDRIKLSAVSGIDNFQDIKAFITQDGDDTVIDLDSFSAGLSITLDSIGVGKINAADFIF